MNHSTTLAVDNFPSIATMQGAPGSSLWINKLKIVGSGQNWAVAPCEPFYLMGIEPPAPDVALTGAKNLIEHYGLGNAYQKFCSKPLREELSAFLPHLTGNVDVPASVDGSGLMSLIERPPIRGKELRPFAPGQLDHAFRLHPGPLPQEYASLFAAAPVKSMSRSNQQGSQDTTTADLRGTSSCRIPASAAPGLTSFSRRRRRYEVHRGLSVASSVGGGSGGTVTTTSGPGSSTFCSGPPPPPMSTHNTTPLSAVPFPLSVGPGVSNPPSSETLRSYSSGKSIEHPPGLIHVSNTVGSMNQSECFQQQPPPPPPLLSSVHQVTSVTASQRSTIGGSVSSSESVSLASAITSNISGPPLLHSIHASCAGNTHSALAASSRNAPPASNTHLMDHTKLPSPGLACITGSVTNTGILSPVQSTSPDWQRMRHSETLDDERKKKKRKERKRRKERE